MYDNNNNNLLSNYDKINNYYESGLDSDDLDERFNTTEKTAYAPGQFTPFAKQGSSNKLNINVSVVQDGEDFNQNSQRSYSSYRALNLNGSDQINMASNLKDIVYIH